MERVEPGPPDRVRVPAELHQRCTAWAGSASFAIASAHSPTCGDLSVDSIACSCPEQGPSACCCQGRATSARMRACVHAKSGTASVKQHISRASRLAEVFVARDRVAEPAESSRSVAHLRSQMRSRLSSPVLTKMFAAWCTKSTSRTGSACTSAQPPVRRLSRASHSCDIRRLSSEAHERGGRQLQVDLRAGCTPRSSRLHEASGSLASLSQQLQSCV